jgi:hypothetical protein
MLTCKQVSNALSKEDYEKMPPMRRFFLRLHVRLCVFCGKFNRQVMDSQDMCRCYREHEEALAAHRPKLESERKNQLKELLASQSGSPKSGE